MSNDYVEFDIDLVSEGLSELDVCLDDGYEGFIHHQNLEVMRGMASLCRISTSEIFFRYKDSRIPFNNDWSQKGKFDFSAMIYAIESGKISVVVGETIVELSGCDTSGLIIRGGEYIPMWEMGSVAGVSVTCFDTAGSPVVTIAHGGQTKVLAYRPAGIIGLSHGTYMRPWGVMSDRELAIDPRPEMSNREFSQACSTVLQILDGKITDFKITSSLLELLRVGVNVGVITWIEGDWIVKKRMSSMLRVYAVYFRTWLQFAPLNTQTAAWNQLEVLMRTGKFSLCSKCKRHSDTPVCGACSSVPVGRVVRAKSLPPLVVPYKEAPERVLTVCYVPFSYIVGGGFILAPRGIHHCRALFSLFSQLYSHDGDIGALFHIRHANVKVERSVRSVFFPYVDLMRVHPNMAFDDVIKAEIDTHLVGLAQGAISPSGDVEMSVVEHYGRYREGLGAIHDMYSDIPVRLFEGWKDDLPVFVELEVLRQRFNVEWNDMEIFVNGTQNSMLKWSVAPYYGRFGPVISPSSTRKYSTIGPGRRMNVREDDHATYNPGMILDWT